MNVEYRIFWPAPQAVHLPVSNDSLKRFLGEGMGNQWQLLSAEAHLPLKISTRLTRQVFDFAQLALINVVQAGWDPGENCVWEQMALAAKGLAVLQIWLDSCLSWGGAAVGVLRDQSCFLS